MTKLKKETVLALIPYIELGFLFFLGITFFFTLIKSGYFDNKSTTLFSGKLLLTMLFVLIILNCYFVNKKRTIYKIEGTTLFLFTSTLLVIFILGLILTKRDPDFIIKMTFIVATCGVALGLRFWIAGILEWFKVKGYKHLSFFMIYLLYPIIYFRFLFFHIISDSFLIFYHIMAIVVIMLLTYLIMSEWFPDHLIYTHLARDDIASSDSDGEQGGQELNDPAI